MANDFALDVARIRDQARQHMGDGPVTGTYGADRARVVDVLNDVVATEIVCWLRYTRHAISASGTGRGPVASEFKEHADEELQHALRAADRVNQLGGEPDLDPATLARRAHTSYVTTEGTDLHRMLEENLAAERIVISAYQEIIRWLGAGDPTTRRLLESILEQEEEHADDLVELLGR
ncbi:MAG: ferritin-like domain-containing protein [Acidimicrobiales bacterium]